MDEPASFTCPRCGATSYNSNDLAEGYCGRCHDWTGRRMVGELTGLPLAKFATAELVARARSAGFINLWDYVEALEMAVYEEGIWHHVVNRRG